jgi:hypothetical protein
VTDPEFKKERGKKWIKKIHLLLKNNHLWRMWTNAKYYRKQSKIYFKK